MKTTAEKTDVAIRPLLGEDAAALLRAILAAGDYGVLLTDLDHRSLACNRQFGNFFNVRPEDVVRFGVEELRDKVAPLIPDPASWVDRLNEIYSEPYRQYEDDLTLLHQPPIVIHRFTGPVFGADGELIGRIWTFRDVSARKRTERIGEILHELSTFHDPDPAAVNRRVLETVAEFYGTNALLSIRSGERLEFREVAGQNPIFRTIGGNDLPNSYCRWALKEKRPILVQDGRSQTDLAPRRALQAGLTRYLGAPVFDVNGKAVGTLCLLDGKSEEALDDEDVRFMSLLAMRVSAELSREHFIRMRTAAQEETLRRQRQDLATTEQVLSAMNLSLQLIGEPDSAVLIDAQLQLLKGVLGYESAAILLPAPTLRAAVLAKKSGKVRRSRIDLREWESIANLVLPAKATLRILPVESSSSKSLGSAFVAAAALSSEGKTAGLLLLGRDDPPPLEDRHHATHLEAVVEQVNLVLAAHLMQTRLHETSEELRGARQQLIENEKLSAVGTLAAATAHDIRNILSSLSFELADAPDPELALQAVRDQLDRFKVLAHRLLSYARPKRIAPSAVCLEEVFKEVIALTGAHAKIAGVRIVCEPGPELPLVSGEPHQLAHLFVNLVLNAIQAMEPGGGKLELKASRFRQNVVVQVSDTGRGIAGKDLAKLFQPFSTGRAEGFGLGLYSCQRIVEEHGGTIAVSSEIGKGTIFKITLKAIPKEGGTHGRKTAARR